MNNENQLNLLRQVKNLLKDFSKVDKILFKEVGLTTTECLKPTENTIIKLHNYKFKKNKEIVEIERLDFNL